MGFEFKKATRGSGKARVLFYGPPGSGKTYTALSVAKHLGGGIAVIDTERGSAAKYAGIAADFAVLELPDTKPQTYVDAISAASNQGFGVLVVDSITHEWETLLEYRDKVASAKFKGNTWAASSVTKPIHRQFIEALLQYPGHVLCTARSKNDWSADRGRPKVVGLKPLQSDEIVHEFDIAILMDAANGVVTKTRCVELNDEVITRPGANLAGAIQRWLSGGYSQPVGNAVDNNRADVIDAEVVESGPTQEDGVNALTSVLAECYESNVSMLDEWLKRLNRPNNPCVADMDPETMIARAEWLRSEGQRHFGRWLNMEDSSLGGWAVRELCRAGYDESAAIKIARGTADKHDRREFLHHIRSHHLRQAMRMASPEAVRGWIAANMPDVATGNLEKAIQAASLRCELNAVTLAEQVSQFETEGGDE